MKTIHRRTNTALLVPLLFAAVAVSGCDIVTADYKAKESVEWRKTYQLAPGGSVEILNVNGKIDVQPASGDTVEVIAVKTAKAASVEAARELLQRIEIVEQASPNSVKVETKVPRASGLFHMGGQEVAYTVRVPVNAKVRFDTTNGGIELAGLGGQIEAETTNGGIRAREVSGPIAASTTNGGVDVELTRVADGGVKLECTNGGIKLRLPRESKASIYASVTNGGIDAEDGLSLETSESSRRKLEGRMNGGGPSIRLEGVNGGIRIGAR